MASAARLFADFTAGEPDYREEACCGEAATACFFADLTEEPAETQMGRPWGGEELLAARQRRQVLRAELERALLQRRDEALRGQEEVLRRRRELEQRRRALRRSEEAELLLQANFVVEQRSGGACREARSASSSGTASPPGSPFRGSPAHCQGLRSASLAASGSSEEGIVWLPVMDSLGATCEGLAVPEAPLLAESANCTPLSSSRGSSAGRGFVEAEEDSPPVTPRPRIFVVEQPTPSSRAATRVPSSTASPMARSPMSLSPCARPARERSCSKGSLEGSASEAEG